MSELTEDRVREIVREEIAAAKEASRAELHASLRSWREKRAAAAAVQPPAEGDEPPARRAADDDDRDGRGSQVESTT